MATKLTIPYNFVPRSYQLELLKQMDSGCLRAICIWHRRAGKDKTLINLMAKKALEKVGVYYYFFPTYSQARKVIWDGIDGAGFKFIDHLPKEIITNKNDQEMKIKLVNGSLIQVVGTDKYDSVRGTNPVGCIFSEYAFHNPMAWDVVRPILAENGGWAVFNTTPNGKNHAYDMITVGKTNPKWFTQILTVKDTGAITEEMVQEERNSGMSPETVAQEFYCSFETGGIGSYYTDVMSQAYSEDRINKVPFYIDRDIDVYFDLGINDMMAMWFKQDHGQSINIINYYEDNNKGLDYYYRYIREYLEQKKGKLGHIYLPHDAKHRDNTLKTDEMRFIEEFGSNKIRVIEIGSRKTGINEVRRIFPRCTFDRETCSQGIRCLENYKREYDIIKKVFKDTPSHDWSSHGADAFRYLAMSVDKFSSNTDNAKLERYAQTQVLRNYSSISGVPD